MLPTLRDGDAAEHHEEARVIAGVEMTKSALAAALASEGLEEIAADGAFDPHVHEALLAQPTEGFEPGSIELRLASYAQADLPHRLARFLLEATGERWLITVSRLPGEPSLREQRNRLWPQEPQR